MDDLQVEPELQRSPPRRVRRRGTRGYGTLFSQFFVAPMLLLCLFMPVWGIHLVIIRAFGPVVSCQIVDRYRKYDEDDHKWLYYLKYSANMNGQSQIVRELVDKSDYDVTLIGSKQRLQISPLFPGYDSVLLLAGRNVWEIVWIFSIASLLMLACAILLFWFVYILPTRRRKLVVYGVPVIGRLFNKTKYTSSKSESYYFHYEYTPVTSESAFGATAEMTTLQGRQNVRSSDWEHPRIGENYTIIYDPKKPEFSVIYLYGDYEAF